MAEILSFSFNGDSKSELISLQKELGFRGRSETIRAALKVLAKETSALSKLKGVVSAVLIVTHSHNPQISKIIHSNEKLVITHTHQHINHNCVEIFALKGDAGLVRAMYLALLKHKLVLDVKITLL